MKNSILPFAIIAVLSNVAFPGTGHAQLLLDQAIGGSVGGGTELGSAAHGLASPEMVMQRLQQQGYSNIAASPVNPQQFTATSPVGTPVLITVEPTMGHVISVVPQ